MAKIMWVIHGAEVYGESRAVCSLMRGVRDSGWEAQAISLTRGTCYQQIKDEGFDIQWLEIKDTAGMSLATSRFSRFWESIKLVGYQFPVRRRITQSIHEARPDAVHVLSKNILPAVGWAARRAGIPCFWEMTAVVGKGYWLDMNRRLYRRLLKSQHIAPLANSHYTAETLGDVGKPVEVMHLGADPVQFDPEKVEAISRAELGIPAEAVVLIIVSRIDQSKGQQVVLEAVDRLKNPALHVVLVGDATLESDRELIANMKARFGSGAAPWAHFVGFSKRPESYLAMADIAVNSRIDAEPFGLSVVEAMLMRKPVLAHALGGPAETVLDGQTGWHVKDMTVEQMAQGLERALADRARWVEMGRSARERAVANFSLPLQTKRYREIVLAHSPRLRGV